MLRLARISVLVLLYANAVVHLDEVADRVIQRCSKRPHKKYVDGRLVALYRDFYYVMQGAFMMWALVSGSYSAWWVQGMAAYFIAVIGHGLIGPIFVWGKHSINPARSLLLAVWAYFTTALGFAILYLNCACLNKPVTATEAVYFSFVTSATVGFGDIYPCNDLGYALVMGQIGVFVLFALVAITVLASRISPQVRRRRPDY